MFVEENAIGRGMLLWIACAVLSAAALAVVLRPLLSAAPSPDVADSSAVYRDQLAEIDAERERGLLAPAEAEAAHAEVARRLLASAAERDAAATPIANASRGALTAAIALGVPAVVAALYLMVGSPNMPDQPLSARLPQSPQAAEITRLIEAVEARLKSNPEDGRGWEVIAPVYLRRGNHAKAAIAFERTIALLGETPQRLMGFAEATVLANEGHVTEPAHEAFRRLAELTPDEIAPRFWLGVYDEQSGRGEEAERTYRALLAGPGLESHWRSLLEERLTAVIAVRSGSEPSRSPAEKAPPPAIGQQRGPSTTDMAAAEKMSPDDRQRMIENMVSGLAERLNADGRDLAGWQRLIRAYTVLGRKEAALEALARARSNFASEPQSLTALADLARTLGLES